MSDNFQSKAVVKPPRAAKTVVVKGKTDATEVVPGENLNDVALQFIRRWKRSQASQQ